MGRATRGTSFSLACLAASMGDPGHCRSQDAIVKRRAGCPVAASEYLQNCTQTQEGARNYELWEKRNLQIPLYLGIDGTGPEKRQQERFTRPAESLTVLISESLFLYEASQ